MAEVIGLTPVTSQFSQQTTETARGSTALAEQQQHHLGDEPENASALPPVDTGHRAWLFLAGATTIEIFVWGLPFAVGILHVYWTNTLFPGYNASTITLAATLQTGLLYMSTAFFGPIIAAFPRYQRHFQILGLSGACISLISSGFVTKPFHLVITWGCIFPLAGSLYMPCATLLFEWFFERRGLASGIMYAGTGIGGTVFPYIINSLLSSVGYKATMVSLGVAYAIIGGIALIPTTRRVPLSRYGSGEPGPRRQGLSLGFMKSFTFFMGIFTILFTSLGNFVPSLWLPSYADDLNLTSPSGTALISILNAASVPGNFLLGFMSDHIPLQIVISISCIGTALSCAFLWGWGTGGGTLVGFCIVFGLLGQSFTALWTQMIVYISKDDPLASPLVFCTFAFMRGVGNITSGPISGALLNISALRGATGAYGFRNYGILLIYTAVTILLGAVTGLLFKAR
ncbi:hypothetical protein, variant 1 [Cryptococcus amylolentus CBS 6039]|uniref:Major facilitator superfamily (MFS) profile domain-containing protein n=3 Tax=Cryptococcus amylolentus TaxID=104669 RepID=A0A1E3I4H7_9TREE|nr:hypothetical protein, variant 1 [Cryptococcus amylolentus CBS 6039]ODN82711.1 hypothetical protein, variant 1 [Cryptococcus amylolentus CBS 6039]ODO10395.1 hypothetical protein I350_00990 [Cryptococcus amylolentus CBS 6273]